MSDSWAIIGPISIATDQRTAWLARVRLAIGPGPWRSHDEVADSNIPHAYTECTSPDQTTTPIRLIYGEESQLWVHVRSRIDDDTDRWIRALDEATEALASGEPGPITSWTAYIGPDDYMGHSGRLSGPLHVTSLSLEPASVPTFDVAGSPQDLGGGLQLRWVWLVKASATDFGYWRDVEQRAASSLHRTCGLLSAPIKTHGGCESAPRRSINPFQRSHNERFSLRCQPILRIARGLERSMFRRSQDGSPRRRQGSTLTPISGTLLSRSTRRA